MGAVEIAIEDARLTARFQSGKVHVHPDFAGGAAYFCGLADDHSGRRVAKTEFFPASDLCEACFDVVQADGGRWLRREPMPWHMPGQSYTTRHAIFWGFVHGTTTIARFHVHQIAGTHNALLWEITSLHEVEVYGQRLFTHYGDAQRALLREIDTQIADLTQERAKAAEFTADQAQVR